MLIRNAEIRGQIKDVLLEDGRIVDIGDNIRGNNFYEAQGRALIPGLHDHHIHLNATAAAMNSVSCGPPNVKNQSDLIERLNQVGDGWVRGVGYHRSVAGEINREWLDTHGPKRPIRIQHRSGRLWILNSLAMKELGLKYPKNGRLLDGDFKTRTDSSFPNLKPLIYKLLSYGITGVTEVTPSNGLVEFENYINNAKPLRLAIMGRAVLSSQQSQHLKLHYHDHDLPALEDLANEIVAAHGAGRNIAAHCVTRAELMLTLAALNMAGSIQGDRIEHAAIADEVTIAWMKRLGLTVVTQPNFIVEREAAYLNDVPNSDHQNLWRLKAFKEVGLKLAAGSDAPFGDPNPWAAMAAAVCRPMGFEAEAVTPEEALQLYTKPAHDAGAESRCLEVGEVADMCLLDKSWAQARENLTDVNVIATWIGGGLVYNRVD